MTNVTDTADPSASGLAPAGTAQGPAGSGALVALLRLGIAVLWIENVGWKTPPDFSSLRSFTQDAVDHPVLAPYAWLVEHVILPNFTFFAWGVLLVESALGVFLLLGLATRFWAVVGIAQSLAITLSVLNAPHEWEWSYYLMILAHVAILGTAAGRTFGLDGLLRPRWRESAAEGGKASRLLLRVS